MEIEYTHEPTPASRPSKSKRGSSSKGKSSFNPSGKSSCITMTRRHILCCTLSIAALIVLASGVVFGIDRANRNRNATSAANAMAAVVDIEECIADDGFETWLEEQEDMCSLEELISGTSYAEEEEVSTDELTEAAEEKEDESDGYVNYADFELKKEEDGPVRKLLRGERSLDKEKISTSSVLPYLVSIGDNYGHRCAGTVISTSDHGVAILTAAHCFTNQHNGSFERMPWVEFNRYDLNDAHHSNSDGVVRVYIRHSEDHIVRHPDFHYKDLEYDLALIILTDHSLVELAGLRTVSLNDDDDVPEVEGAALRAYGWGLNSYDPHDVADVPQDVRVDYVTNESCTKSPYEWVDGRITESMMCAYTERAKVCNKDSGGPLMLGSKQVGISSFIAKDHNGECIIEGYPHVYARVSKGLPWIKDVVCDKIGGDFCPYYSKSAKSKSSKSKSYKESGTKSSKSKSAKSTEAYYKYCLKALKEASKSGKSAKAGDGSSKAEKNPKAEKETGGSGKAEKEPPATGAPTSQPTGTPTVNPTSQPTGVPTGKPTSQPTGAPTVIQPRVVDDGDEVEEVEENDEEDREEEAWAVQCNGPNANRPCPPGKPVAYTCEGGEEMCCKWTYSQQNSKDRRELESEIDLPEFGHCTKDE